MVDNEHDATVFMTDETPPAEAADDAHDNTEFADSSNVGTHDGVDRTQHAAQAVELGVVFRHRFQTVSFGISPKWRIRLTTPDGMSTEGGKKARQAIVIYREGAPSTDTFTLGYLDTFQNTASIKTYDVMVRAYELRYRRDVELVESEYERLLDQLRKFSSALGLEVRMLSIDDAIPGHSAGPRKKGEPRQFSIRSAIVILIGILGVGVVIGYALAN